MTSSGNGPGRRSRRPRTIIAIVVFAALVTLGPIVSGIFDEMGDSLQMTL